MKEPSKLSRLELGEDERGFFKKFYDEFRKSVTPQEFQSFCQLQSDEERVKFVSKILPDCKYISPEENGGKNSALAAELKLKGNKEFIRGDTEKALQSYTASLLHSPGSAVEDIALVVANRSAALYHLKMYDEAICDVDFALSRSYPKELQFKILERKAKCLLALKRHSEALEAFRKTLQALDESKLATEKKLKIQKDIQIMLSLLSKDKTNTGHTNALAGEIKNKPKDLVLPAVSAKRNARFPAMSDLVNIEEGEVVGRYATARRDIAAGTTIIVEKSYCSVLLAEHASTHCLHCFKRAPSPYPCQNCSVAVFCSIECNNLARDYHRYECTFAKSLHQSGLSVIVLMALRLITQKSLAFFLQIKNQLQQDPRKVMNTYKSDDYQSVYNLVRHEDRRPAENFFERSAVSVVLLRCLQRVGYFGSIKIPNKDLNGDESFIGGLILRHSQLLQFNAHEIAELETDCTETMDYAQSKFLGGGLYPTLALFNHSCDPGIVRYNIGTSILVKTIRPVCAGEQVSENYGPIFTNDKREFRRAQLRLQYWFDCNCRPCEENWELLEEMDRKIIPFRCDGGDDFKCPGIIRVPFNTEEFMVKCGKCGRHTNLFKGLKSLQETDVKFKKAMQYMNSGKMQTALELYLEILALLHKHLAPPFYDYHLCQQAIRKCMLSMGNRYAKEI